MAAAKVRSLIANKDYTHTLSIGLAKSSLLPQFETTLQRLRKDALATNIPEKAYTFFGHLSNVLIGRVKLKSPQSRELFARVVHSLNYSKLIGPAPESAQSSSGAREILDTARSLSHVPPLKVNISGLTTHGSNPSASRSLYAWVVDPTGRLRPFLHSLIDVFTTAGIPILTPVLESRLQFVNSNFVNWHRSNPLVKLPNGSRRYQSDFRVPVFDSRDLLKKYENESWATDVRLERLSLLALGVTEKNPDGEKVFKEQPEVDSVALP